MEESDMNEMQNFTLTNHNIDTAYSALETFFDGAHAERRDILRARLAAEEVLLQYQEAFGTQGTFQLQCKKRMRHLYAELTIPGERKDVIYTDGDDESGILRRILSGMGGIPAWQYQNGINVISFVLKKKKASPPWFRCWEP